SELLEKTIQYHDPNGNWENFEGILEVTMEVPEGSNRYSKIHIDRTADYFQVEATRDSITTTYTLDKGKCEIALNGQSDLAESVLETHQLSCERANMYKNYYTYLYGLPMKLKDAGTIIDPEVTKQKFKGKEYLVLKVSYEQEVGSDVWFFYFDPKTFAMEIYQFYKGDPKSVGKDTGEYILLSGEKLINGIKMPKNRAWYYNKDDGYLGVDKLQ
ncbi:MAG: hypothetical protein HKM28_04895, partial [Flavobacteriaceae bacterium]|nr:hypothetical protein [Flavobacteriaceae bacterium]